MILVDTSVLIDYFRGGNQDKTLLFEEILQQDIPFGISPYTYQELLQGARSETEFTMLRDYLSTQTMYKLPDKPDTFERAARLYYDLRRKGITIRSTIDVLIALTAIENRLRLLHNDHDFDQMALHQKDLRILTTI